MKPTRFTAVALAALSLTNGGVAQSARPQPVLRTLHCERTVRPVQDEVRPEEREQRGEARSEESAKRFDEIRRTRELERGNDKSAEAAEGQRARPTVERGRFEDDAKLQDHWRNHGSDFGAKSAEEYERQADRFLNGPRDADTLEKQRKNGDIIRFDPKTDEFGVARSDGVIRTYFKPDPARNGKSNLEYFNDQK